MPGGGSDSESDKGDYQKQDDREGTGDSKNVSRQSSRASRGKKGPDDDVSDGDRDHHDGGGGYGGGGEQPVPENEQWTKKLHVLMLVTLGLSLLLLIIITATQSWGIGKILDLDLSAGLWDLCCDGEACLPEPTCVSWGDFCPDAEGHIAASGAFCIITIIVLAVMLVMQLLAFLKPGKIGCFAKCQMILGHILWFLLMLCWVLWSASHNGNDCVRAKHGDHLYYAWGWMFVLWMWLVHLGTAILVTMKVMGKPLPCGC